MISHERKPSRSPRGPRPHWQPHSTPHSPRPSAPEDVIKSAEVQIERKTFVFTLKENPRGRFLRITEDVNGRRESIIVPATGLEDFKRLVESMVAEAGKPAAPTEDSGEFPPA